jgi:phenylacetaldehyde dehydrogenase
MVANGRKCRAPSAVACCNWGAIDPRLPWGGFKTSGIGRELGARGLDACTEEKVVTVVM